VTTPTNQPGDEILLDRFATINIWRRGEERAPHKPMLLLYALAALQRGEDRLIPFAAIEEGWEQRTVRCGLARGVNEV